jgi:hypothetical protein
MAYAYVVFLSQKDQQKTLFGDRFSDLSIRST